MKYAWLTDIHLNCLELAKRTQFYQEILDTNCHTALISGDIAEAPNVIELLKEMANYIQKPIYFVLGNHDYYHGHIADVHAAMTKLTQTESLLFWLPASGPHMLEENIILVGQDGWADGRLGNYQNSHISLKDSHMIIDLIQKQALGKYQVLEKMQQLADQDAQQLHNDLNQAIQQSPKKIIILTHVPPFKEACFYQGKISNDDWLPYFSSKATGDVLTHFAQENSNIEFLVLCGHTHSEAYYQPLHNLTIKVGNAEYGQPEIQPYS